LRQSIDRALSLTAKSGRFRVKMRMSWRYIVGARLREVYVEPRAIKRDLTGIAIDTCASASR